jgi:hypothetical protein
MLLVQSRVIDGETAWCGTAETGKWKHYFKAPYLRFVPGQHHHSQHDTDDQDQYKQCGIRDTEKHVCRIWCGGGCHEICALHATHGRHQPSVYLARTRS